MNIYTHIITSRKFGTIAVLLDECDSYLVKDTAWCARFVRGNIPHCIARMVGPRPQKALLLHREIMRSIFPNALGKGVCVDHKNGNPFDNRRDNLRICSASENAHNRKASHLKSIGYPGVFYIKSTGKFRALLGSCVATRHLGVFPTMADAIAARQQAERAQYGTFSFSNRLQPN